MRPSQDHPLFVDVDNGTIYDGDVDDNFILHIFDDVQSYTDKKYGVYLEWTYYTDGRAKKILDYIKDILEHTDTVDIWHVWLTNYYEYDEQPVIHSRTISIKELSVKDIKKLENSEIWNNPDKRYPNRPSFYSLTINR